MILSEEAKVEGGKSGRKNFHKTTHRNESRKVFNSIKNSQRLTNVYSKDNERTTLSLASSPSSSSSFLASECL
jgi:hypothetical protein